MPGELRKDPTTGQWVLVRHGEPVGASPASEECPFCPGHEDLTPREIAAYRANGSQPNAPGWQVRVIPERDPYFVIEKELVRVLSMYRDRVQDLKRDPKIRCVIVTRRYGKEGSRIHHPYSRVLATPIVFDEIRTELSLAREYFAYKHRCVYCDTIREETAAGERVVSLTPHFVVFVPYAARAPFELRILPRRHACDYEWVSNEEVADLARLLRRLAGILVRALDDPPHELVLHTAPNVQVKIVQGEWETIGRDFHWHLELTPHPDRRTSVGGIVVNDVLPEAAARLLREAGSPLDRPT